MHSVIIGNGIIGLTIAYRLLTKSSDGDLITIVAPKARQGSASAAAGAMLNSFAEIEAGSLSSELDLYRFEMSHLATQMWPSFEKELIEYAGDALPYGCRNCRGFALEGGCAQEGTYVVNNTAADDLDDENFDAILNALKDFNEPYSLVQPRDIPGYRPAQRSRATRAALIHKEGWYNPRLFIEKLDAILSRSPRVRFVDDKVQRLHMSSGKISRIEVDKGVSLEGDHFILAVGASLTELLERSSLETSIQRIFYGVGVSLEVRMAEGHMQPKCIRTPNRGLACGIYSVPYFWDPFEKRKHILLGASNFISERPLQFGRASSIESILKAGMDQVHEDFYKSELVRVNVGWRPVSSDTYPLIGKTDIQNLYIISGTKRDGFHLSPLLSKIIVSQIFGEAQDPRLELFAPNRKIIRSLTREEAITKSLRHMMSAAFQHEYNPSRGRMSTTLIQAYRNDLERIHDQVGAYDWGIPPELIDMYRYGHIAI